MRATATKKKEIVKRYVEGVPPYKIAAEFGYSPRSVLDWVKDAGVWKPTHRWTSDDVISSAIEMYKAGKPPAEISKSTGKSLASVVIWLTKAGIYQTRKGPSEVKKSALAMYSDGIFTTEISRRTGFGTTTICRWAKEAGITQPFRDRIMERFASRPAGREHIGKKGLFHTKKGDVWIPTDSTYELARLEQLEIDPSVAKIGRCRDRIPYLYQGKKHNYLPDFKIISISGSIRIEEIKPERWVVDPKTAAKLSAAAAHYATLSIEYVVVTEKEIGYEYLKSFEPAGLSRMSDEYQDAKKALRREQKRVAQLAYTKRRNETATPEKKADLRRYTLEKTQKYRQAKIDAFSAEFNASGRPEEERSLFMRNAKRAMNNKPPITSR